MNVYIKRSVRAMQGYTPGEQPTDPHVIKLNTNESPYPPSPAVRKALQNLKVDTLRLYQDPVSLALRRKIADLHGGGTDNVIVGNGSDETLALCSRAFVEMTAPSAFLPSYLFPVLAQIRAVTGNVNRLWCLRWIIRPACLRPPERRHPVTEDHDPRVLRALRRARRSHGFLPASTAWTGAGMRRAGSALGALAGLQTVTS